MERAEAALAQLIGRRHAVLTGSGTAALSIACRLAPVARPGVVIPAITCAQVLYAVRYAERLPVLADVREADATLDPEKVAALLESDRRIGAIVAVHTFGHPAVMGALREVAHRHEVLLIEDAAQAQGGVFADGRPFGSAGDVAVLSFGHTKILDAGGGGCLLFDEPRWQERATKLARELAPAADAAELRALYSRRYYDTWAAARRDPQLCALFDEFHVPFRELFMTGSTADQAERIVRSLDALAAGLAHRRKLFALYEVALREVPGVHLFRVDPKRAAPWRFTFRVASSARDGLLEALRGAGQHASAWYPCLAGWHREARMAGAAPLGVARRLENEIVNLWLDRGTTEPVARQAVELARRFLSGKEATV